MVHTMDTRWSYKPKGKHSGVRRSKVLVRQKGVNNTVERETYIFKIVIIKKIIIVYLKAGNTV